MTIQSLHAAISYFESIGSWQLAGTYRQILQGLTK